LGERIQGENILSGLGLQRLQGKGKLLKLVHNCFLEEKKVEEVGGLSEKDYRKPGQGRGR